MQAVRQRETHKLVTLLLKRKEKRLKRNVEAELSKHTDHKNWKALDCAVYCGQYTVVWQLLQSSGTTKETNDMKTAMQIAEIILEESRQTNIKLPSTKKG